MAEALGEILIQVEEHPQLVRAHEGELPLGGLDHRAAEDRTGQHLADTGHFFQRAPYRLVGEKRIHATAIGHEVARVHRPDAFEQRERDAVDQLAVIHVCMLSIATFAVNARRPKYT